MTASPFPMQPNQSVKHSHSHATSAVVRSTTCCGQLSILGVCIVFTWSCFEQKPHEEYSARIQFIGNIKAPEFNASTLIFVSALFLLRVRLNLWSFRLGLKAQRSPAYFSLCLWMKKEEIIGHTYISPGSLKSKRKGEHFRGWLPWNTIQPTPDHIKIGNYYSVPYA